MRLANEETSGLAAGIVTEDEGAAARVSSTGTAVPPRTGTPPRFTDGFELTGSPETGINVDWTPGPRGPVTYQDLWLRQYRIVGDGPSGGEAADRRQAGSSLVAGPRGRIRRSVLSSRAREIAVLVRAGTPVCVVSSGAIALGLRSSASAVARAASRASRRHPR